MGRDSLLARLVSCIAMVLLASSASAAGYVFVTPSRGTVTNTPSSPSQMKVTLAAHTMDKAVQMANYSYDFRSLTSVSNGEQAAVTYTISAGSLPLGLSLTNNGILSGEPYDYLPGGAAFTVAASVPGDTTRTTYRIDFIDAYGPSATKLQALIDRLSSEVAGNQISTAELLAMSEAQWISRYGDIRTQLSLELPKGALCANRPAGPGWLCLGRATMLYQSGSLYIAPLKSCETLRLALQGNARANCVVDGSSRSQSLKIALVEE